MHCFPFARQPAAPAENAPARASKWASNRHSQGSLMRQCRLRSGSCAADSGARTIDRASPRLAPVGSTTMARSSLRRYVEQSDPEWVTDGRGFHPEECALMEDMLSHCGCGERLYPEEHQRARVRCPECLGTDIARGPIEADFD